MAPMPESAAAQGSVTAAGVREAVVAVVPWHISHAIIQPASQSLRHSYQLDARSTYVYPQAVEEVSMPGNNQSDADAVFDAAATKVQAVLRGAKARRRSEAGVRLGLGLGLGFGFGLGLRVRAIARALCSLPLSAVRPFPSSRMRPFPLSPMTSPRSSLTSSPAISLAFCERRSRASSTW